MYLGQGFVLTRICHTNTLASLNALPIGSLTPFVDFFSQIYVLYKMWLTCMYTACMLHVFCWYVVCLLVRYVCQQNICPLANILNMFEILHGYEPVLQLLACCDEVSRAHLIRGSFVVCLSSVRLSAFLSELTAHRVLIWSFHNLVW